MTKPRQAAAALASFRQSIGVTIPAGSSDSGPANAGGGSLKRILVPASTQGAGLLVLHADDGNGPFLPAVSREGVTIVAAIAPSTAVDLENSVQPGKGVHEATRYFKLRTTADTAGATPQVQSADRTFVVTVVE